MPPKFVAISRATSSGGAVRPGAKAATPALLIEQRGVGGERRGGVDRVVIGGVERDRDHAIGVERDDLGERVGLARGGVELRDVFGEQQLGEHSSRGRGSRR